MRKLFNLFAVALVMLAASSCEKNEVLPEGNTAGKVVTLKASINNGETKTSLGEKDGDTYPVLWSEGDAIAVIQTKNVEIEGEETTETKIFKFVLQGEGGTTNGVFNLVEYDECGYTASDFDASKEIKAFYPFAGVWESGTLQSIMYTVPATQNHTIHNDNETSYSTFGNGASPMAAYADNAAAGLTFKNLFGVLKLQLKGTENVKSISLTSNLYLSNYARVSFGVNSVINMDEDDADKSVILSCGEGVALNTETATDFLICVPPGEHSFALTINSTIGGTPKTYDLSTQQTITAGNIKKMAVIDLSLAYIENGVYLGEGIALPAGEGKTIIWAPVNCGYDENHKYGLQYQWGRKYGQGYDGEIPAAVLENELIISVEAGSDEANKNNYYYKWLDSDSNSEDDYNMWYNNTPEATTTKTQYDPCPEGWRVPTNGELISLIYGLTEDHMTFGQQSHWATISDSNDKHDGLTGLWFYGNEEEPTDSSPKVFFPAAGYRYYIYSRSQYRDFMGNYWSSSRNQVGFAWGLEFHNSIGIEVRSTPILPNNGYSVRCVKDTPQSEPMPSGN